MIKEDLIPLRSIISSGVTSLQRVEEYKKTQSRELRKKSTFYEKILWEHLRNRQVDKLKFRRQQIIEGYIVDFFCEEAKLVIEIDGCVHNTPERKKVDQHRDAVFAARGLHTIHFRNHDVKHNLYDCIKQIFAVVKNRRGGK